jgi:hypothetical protein
MGSPRTKVKTYFCPVNLEFAKKAKRGFAFFERKNRKNRSVFSRFYSKKGAGFARPFLQTSGSPGEK